MSSFLSPKRNANVVDPFPGLFTFYFWHQVPLRLSMMAREALKSQKSPIRKTEWTLELLSTHSTHSTHCFATRFHFSPLGERTRELDVRFLLSIQSPGNCQIVFCPFFHGCTWPFLILNITGLGPSSDIELNNCAQLHVDSRHQGLEM